MVNPFEYNGEDLISISSCCVASENTRDQLITEYSIGHNGAKFFVEDRMTSETDTIFNPIKTNKLKTFFTIEKIAFAMLISETVSIKASSDMFNRLFIIGKNRDIDLEELLSYAQSSVPMSLGTTDAIVKAKRMHELEKDVEPVAQVPAGSALIVDGMAFIHQIHTMPSTFGQLADRLLQDLMVSEWISSVISTLCKASRTVCVVLWVALRSSTSQDLTRRHQGNSRNIWQMGETNNY